MRFRRTPTCAALAAVGLLALGLAGPAPAQVPDPYDLVSQTLPDPSPALPPSVPLGPYELRYNPPPHCGGLAPWTRSCRLEGEPGVDRARYIVGTEFAGRLTFTVSNSIGDSATLDCNLYSPHVQYCHSVLEGDFRRLYGARNDITVEGRARALSVDPGDIPYPGDQATPAGPQGRWGYYRTSPWREEPCAPLGSAPGAVLSGDTDALLEDVVLCRISPSIVPARG